MAKLKMISSPSSLPNQLAAAPSSPPCTPPSRLRGAWLLPVLTSFLVACGGGEGDARPSSSAAAAPMAAPVKRLSVTPVSSAADPFLGVPPTSAFDQLSTFAETQYANHFPKGGSEGLKWAGVVMYRYYPATGKYLGVPMTNDGSWEAGRVYVTGGEFATLPNVVNVGALSAFITPVVIDAGNSQPVSGTVFIRADDGQYFVADASGIKPLANKTSYKVGFAAIWNCWRPTANPKQENGNALISCQDAVSLKRHYFEINVAEKAVYDFKGTVPPALACTENSNFTWSCLTGAWTSVLERQFVPSGAPGESTRAVKTVDGWYNVQDVNPYQLLLGTKPVGSTDDVIGDIFVISN